MQVLAHRSAPLARLLMAPVTAADAADPLDGDQLIAATRPSGPPRPRTPRAAAAPAASPAVVLQRWPTRGRR